MAEDIYKQPPILFSDDDKKNEYQKKLEQKTKKLLEATESQNVTEALVKMIYGEDFGLPIRLLDTQAEARGETVLDLANAIEKIRGYNEFRGSRVAEAVRSLHHQGYVMDAKFGREGSPVLYVNPPYWENQASNYVRKDGYSPRKFQDEEREKMYLAIGEALHKTKPDELGIDQFGYVRAWWD
jgi:hypothetical protein